MKKGYIYIILSAILFSTMEIVIKVMSSDFHPIQLNFLRFLIGAIVLAPLAIHHMRKSGFTLNKENLFFFVITGFLCVVISMTLYQLAIVYGKASTVAILFSCNPLFVVPLAHFLLKEKLTKRTIWALIISLAGILSIVNPFEISDAAGIVYSLLSALSFALYSVVGKKGNQEYKCDGVILTCFSFITGSLEILALILISKINAVSNWLTNIGLDVFANVPITHGITWSTLPGLIYIGIFVTGLGFAFYFLAMDETSASTASMVFFIKPALAPILALLILKEAISANTATGILFIMIGSCLILFADKKPPKLSFHHPKVHSNIRSNS